MALLRFLKKSYPTRVLLLVAAYYGVLQAGWLAALNRLFTKMTVLLSSLSMDLLGIEANTIGDIIISEGKSLLVGYGCEGSEPVILFSIAVLALSGSWRRKLGYAAAGSSILYAMNIGRVVGLMETLKINEDYLDLMHHNVFPMIIAASVFGMWVVSIKRIGR